MRRSGSDASDATEAHNTVYSDVSFMDRDSVGFSLRLRQSGSPKMSASMMSAFLPDLMPTPEEAAEEEVVVKAPRMSEQRLAALMESYDGCPEDHPDCNAREERWEQIEDMTRKDRAELAALEQVLFEATSGRDGAKSKREVVTQRLEDMDDQNLDKQQNVRKLKDEILSSQAATEETTAAAKKLQAEVNSLVLLIAEQEKALQHDGDRDRARDEVVAPTRGPRTHEGDLDAFAVSMLPRGLPGKGGGGSGWH